MRQIPRRR